MMNLFELRKQYEAKNGQDVSISEIARRVHIPRHRLARYERGESVPDVLEASLLAAFFNMSLPEFIGAVRATLDQHKPHPTDALN